MALLCKNENALMARVIKRPSATCRSPYVADIEILSPNHEHTNTVVQAHSPSLGCCGLCDTDSMVIVIPIENSEKKTCKFRIISTLFVEEKIDKLYEEVVGTYPKQAENMVEEAIKSNSLSFLDNVTTYQREKKVGISRFDFAGIDKDDNEFILEVKTVPLADYVDMNKKDKKKYLKENPDAFENMDFNDKIAYFPDGYRKSGNAVVSPRALKHIQELERLKIENPNKRYILCFVIQRTDVNCFQTSHIDPTYKAAVLQASNNGVEIVCLQVSWDFDEEAKTCNAYFHSSTLEIRL